MSADIALPEVTEGIEPGTYEAELAMVEEVTGQYGDQFKLWWNLVDSDAEQIASYASKNLGPKAKLRAICEALLGRQLMTGEQLHTKDILRKRCNVVVEMNDNGYPKIVAYGRIRAPKAARKVATANVEELAELATAEGQVNSGPDAQGEGEELPF